MKITKKQIKQIKDFALEFYKKQDFAHNVKHMEKTVRIAEFLAKKENGNLEIVKIGAMLHQFHDNTKKLRNFLKSISLDSKTIEKIIECVEFRPHRKNSKRNVSLEAKIVYDADALQVLGPYGLLREFACNLKARKKSFRKSIRDLRDVQKKFYNSLQTKTAKRLIKETRKLMEKFWKIYDKWNSF